MQLRQVADKDGCPAPGYLRWLVGLSPECTGKLGKSVCVLVLPVTLSNCFHCSFPLNSHAPLYDITQYFYYIFWGAHSERFPQASHSWHGFCWQLKELQAVTPSYGIAGSGSLAALPAAVAFLTDLVLCPQPLLYKWPSHSLPKSFQLY